MTRILLCCILALVLFTGCKKEVFLPFTFSGRITDANGNAVAKARITLSNYHRSTLFASGGYYQIAGAKTDNEGYFNVSFNCDSVDERLLVLVSADDYFPYDTGRFYSDIHNNILSLNPVLYKLATVKISFKNTSPVSDSDELYVFHSNELFGPSFYTFIERQYTGGTYDEVERHYTGKDIQGYELTKTKGDTYTIISWTSRKNGVFVTGVDSIFIRNGTQENYHINY